MTKLQEKIVDAITGEIIWRDYTEEETAAVQETQAKILQETQLKAEAEAIKAVEKAALLTKLGITEDEAKLLLS